MSWIPFDNGTSIGEQGSENGSIVLDCEYQSAARISLERDCDIAPFAITCGIYGWMVHTRYMGEEDAAKEDFHQMKNALGHIVDSIPPAEPEPSKEQMNAVTECIGDFIERFP